MTLHPTDFARRSFVWRDLEAHGAAFAELNGAAIATGFGDAATEVETARRMGLADLSPLPRTGYKGRGALDWLRSRKINVPDDNNRAVAQKDGSLVARLAPSEALVLGPLSAKKGTVEKLDDAWPGPDDDARAYRVPRADTNCWFCLTGDRAAEMFAKICGVDLRAKAFADGAIAQTQIARLAGIVIRADLAETPAFHMVTDSASARYVWSVLLDAMAEFDGGPVGIEALRSLVDAR